MQRSILKSKTITTSTHVVKIEYGLSYHKGNKDAYFTVTANAQEKRNGRLYDDWGGAAHDEIKKLTPIFNDLIELHLSDEDGSPMHSTANAAYFVEQALKIAQYTKPEEIEEEAAKGLRCLFSHLRHAPTVEAILKECAPIAATVPSLETSAEAEKTAWSDIYDVTQKMRSKPEEIENETVIAQLEKYRAKRAEAQAVKDAAKAARDKIKEIVAKHVEPLRPIWKAQADAAKLKHGLID